MSKRVFGCYCQDLFWSRYTATLASSHNATFWLPVPGQEVTKMRSTSGSLECWLVFDSLLEYFIGNSCFESWCLTWCQPVLRMSCFDQSCFKECLKWVITYRWGGANCWLWSLCWVDTRLNLGMAVSTPHGSHQAEFEIMRQNVWKKVFVSSCPGHWWVH